MRRVLVLTLLMLAACAGTAQAGPIKETCMGVDPRLGGPCRGVEVFATQGAAFCRQAGVVGDEACTTPVTPRVVRKEIAAYEQSWLHRTLRFQQELGDALPLVNAFWVGTHNSANTASEPFTPSGMDSNQQLSITDQLRLDVRSLEIDVHFVPTPWAGGQRAPVVCHGRGASQMHAGCTTERLFVDRLREIETWLAQRDRDVLLLYVEDHLENEAGHAAAAAALESVLGPRIYRTGADDGGCAELPTELTRSQVLAAGKQVIVMGSCGTGTAWRSISFGDADRRENERGGDGPFAGYPTCEEDRTLAYRDEHFIRYFEDSTGLSAGLAFSGGNPPQEGLTAPKTAAIVRCGVDLTGFDQLLPNDDRLAALAWSWADGEPRAGQGDCIVEARDARFYAERCTKKHAFACQSRDGSWWVDRNRGNYRAAAGRCAGATVAIPRRGVDAQRLRDAMDAARVHEVWVRAVGAARRAKRR